MSETAVKSVISVDNMQYSTREEKPVTIASPTGHQHNVSSGIQNSEANYSVHPQQIGFTQANGARPLTNVGYPLANGGYPPSQIGFSTANVGYYNPGNVGYYTPNVGTPHPAVAYSQNNPKVVVVQQPRVTRIPNDYRSYAAFVTFCCFLPLGVVAMIYSKMCRDAIREGNMADAKENSRMAKILSHASFAIGICALAAIGTWCAVEEYALLDTSTLSPTTTPYRH